MCQKLRPIARLHQALLGSSNGALQWSKAPLLKGRVAISVFNLEMSSTISVTASPAQVWGVFSHVSDWPRWSEVRLGVWNLSSNLWQTGSHLAFSLRMAGLGVPFSVTVTSSDPPARVAWASTKLTVTAVRTFTFEQEGGRTLVTDRKHFSSPVLPVRAVYPRWIIRRMTEAWLRDLKAEAERRVSKP